MKTHALTVIEDIATLPGFCRADDVRGECHGAPAKSGESAAYEALAMQTTRPRCDEKSRPKVTHTLHERCAPTWKEQS
jgi:hypothetical protein